MDEDDSLTDQGDFIRMQLQGDALIFIASMHGGKTQSIGGSIANIRNVLGQDNLNEVKLESAIAQVEDLIMPIIHAFRARTKLEIHGAELAGLFHLLTENNGSIIPIESVENLFNQLADYASGSPVAWRQPVPAMQVALGLIALREVMHHGGFSSVSFPHQEE